MISSGIHPLRRTQTRIINFLDSSPAKGSFGRFQADLSSTPQISSADSSNSQSFMPACVLQGKYIRPRSIQGPDKGDRHSLIHHQKSTKTSLILNNQGDRLLLAKESIINEVTDYGTRSSSIQV